MGCGASKPEDGSSSPNSARVAPGDGDSSPKKAKLPSFTPPKPDEAFAAAIDRLSVGPVLHRGRRDAGLAPSSGGGAQETQMVTMERVLGRRAPSSGAVDEPDNVADLYLPPMHDGGRLYLVRAFDLHTSEERVLLVYVPSPLPDTGDIAALHAHQAKMAREYKSVVSLAGRVSPSLLDTPTREAALAAMVCDSMIAFAGHESGPGQIKNPQLAIPLEAQRGGLSLHVYSGAPVVSASENPVEETDVEPVPVASRRSSVAGLPKPDIDEAFTHATDDLATTVLVRVTHAMGSLDDTSGRATVTGERVTGPVPSGSPISFPPETRSFVFRALDTHSMEEMVILAATPSFDTKAYPYVVDIEAVLGKDVANLADVKLCEEIASNHLSWRDTIELDLKTTPKHAHGGLQIK